MDRRLRCTIALLFVLINFTATLRRKLPIIVDELLPPECSNEPLDSVKAVNVSLRAPGFHMGNYESIIVSPPGQKIARDVIIYWENYFICNGEAQFNYKAFYIAKLDSGKFATVYTDLIYANYAIFTGLRYDIPYSFEVISTDKHGASDVSIIYVPSETDRTKPSKPLSLRKSQIGNDIFMLLWEKPLSQQSFGFHRSNQYTLHWCENEPNSLTQCNGKMYKMSVPITESQHRVKVENPKKNYQFAISTEMVKDNAINTTVSSGLQWEKCSLLPDTRSEVIIVRKIWTTVVSSTYIGLRWKIDCSSMSNLFTAYQIYYCPVISSTNHKCKEKLALKFRTKYPQNNTLPVAIISNLKPATLYMFSVDILTHIDNSIGVMFRTVPHFQSTSHE